MNDRVDREKLIIITPVTKNFYIKRLCKSIESVINLANTLTRCDNTWTIDLRVIVGEPFNDENSSNAFDLDRLNDYITTLADETMRPSLRDRLDMRIIEAGAQPTVNALRQFGLLLDKAHSGYDPDAVYLFLDADDCLNMLRAAHLLRALVRLFEHRALTTSMFGCQFTLWPSLQNAVDVAACTQESSKDNTAANAARLARYKYMSGWVAAHKQAFTAAPSRAPSASIAVPYIDATQLMADADYIEPKDQTNPTIMVKLLGASTISDVVSHGGACLPSRFLIGGRALLEPDGETLVLPDPTLRIGEDYEWLSRLAVLNLARSAFAKPRHLSFRDIRNSEYGVYRANSAISTYLVSSSSTMNQTHTTENVMFDLESRKLERLAFNMTNLYKRLLEIPDAVDMSTFLRDLYYLFTLSVANSCKIVAANSDKFLLSPAETTKNFTDLALAWQKGVLNSDEQ